MLLTAVCFTHYHHFIRSVSIMSSNADQAKMIQNVLSCVSVEALQKQKMNHTAPHGMEQAESGSSIRQTTNRDGVQPMGGYTWVGLNKCYGM